MASVAFPLCSRICAVTVCGSFSVSCTGETIAAASAQELVINLHNKRWVSDVSFSSRVSRQRSLKTFNRKEREVFAKDAKA